MNHRQRLARLLFVGLTAWCGLVRAAEETPVTRGETFLAGLFDAPLGLLPEYRGGKTYWLFHDNYLAAKVLDAPRPDLAARIRSSLVRHGFTNSGKIEILFGEAPQPWPFRHYQLTNVLVVDGKTIRTEIVTAKPLTDWEGYADLLLFASIAQNPDQKAEARRNFDRADALWDGRGFADRVTQKNRLYATYKLALYLIAANKLKIQAPHAAAVRSRLLALQNEEGGWITDYDAALQPVGLANVETTCLAVLALREGK